MEDSTVVSEIGEQWSPKIPPEITRPIAGAKGAPIADDSAIVELCEEASAAIVVTKNADHLLIEVEGLLNKSNTTLDDVNGKLGLTNPSFKAVGDLGESVSDLNNSTRNLTTQLSGKAKPGSTFGISKKVGQRVSKL